MTIHQLSIFIENKAGTLLRVLELFKEAQIQLVASTIADTVEYGIYRIICSEPSRAYQVLKDAGISVALSDVFAITLDNERILLSSMRKIDNGYQITLYNTTIKPETVHVSIPTLGYDETLEFGRYELKIIDIQQK